MAGISADRQHAFAYSISGLLGETHRLAFPLHSALRILVVGHDVGFARKMNGRGKLHPEA